MVLILWEILWPPHLGLATTFPATAESKFLNVLADYVQSASKLISSTLPEEGLTGRQGVTLPAISISVNCATLPENSFVLVVVLSSPPPDLWI